jgi:hypothetical protein
MSTTTAFDAALLDSITPMHSLDGEMWRIPGTGWRISDGDALSPGFPYYYSHDEDGRDYGTVQTLTDALSAILAANKRGEGDHSTAPLARCWSNASIRTAMRHLDRIEKKENA